MNRKILVILLAASQIFTATEHAFAWGPEGHQITAAIAENHLTQTTANACRALLGGQSLADVSTWADEVRPDPRYAYLKQFHFARVPKGKTYETSEIPPGGDVIQAAKNLARFLKTGDIKALGATPLLTQLIKVEALWMVIHAMGDIHQPLHISDPADLGGNEVKVTWIDDQHPQGVPNELHAVLDGKILRLQNLSYQVYAAKLDHATQAEMDTWLNLDFVAWADEGVALRGQIYTFPDQQRPAIDQNGEPSIVIGAKYVENNLPMLENRLLRGGLRLAYILNWIFDAEFNVKK